MKKLIIALALAASLGGCSDITKAYDFVSTPVEVTPRMLYDAENGFKLAAAGLVTYRRLCIKKKIDPVTRECRNVIAIIQPYTRAAKNALVDLRAAVKANNQINAIAAYRELQKQVANVQAERAKAGV